MSFQSIIDLIEHSEVCPTSLFNAIKFAQTNDLQEQLSRRSKFK